MANIVVFSAQSPTELSLNRIPGVEWSLSSSFRPFAFRHSEVQVMNNSPDQPLSRPYRCHDCGSDVGFRSRRRTFTERYLLPVLLLQPVRCGECFRRDYRLIFTQVRQRLSDTPRMMPGKAAAASHRNVA
jgi:hypothetical protein